jgi:two-component system C4-dicarboxylate transport sensor histidine kinase DctB
METARIAELAELGVITASLLHELRQPLFAVKGRLQLAQHAGRHAEPGEIVELLTLVVHMEELLEHYAGLGRTDDSWTEVDLRDAVLRAAAILEPRARQVGGRITVEVPRGPLYVSGRAVAMRQIALNLGQNALDAIAGQPRREVVLSLELADPNTVSLTVKDTGPGIPEELRAHLFEPFVTSKGPRGTGLGLFIARTLVIEARGSLGVDALPAGGTMLTVKLPHAALHEAASAADLLEDLQVVPEEHPEEEGEPPPAPR